MKSYKNKCCWWPSWAKFLEFLNSEQHQMSSVRTFLSAEGEGMLGTSQNTSTSPALAPSLLRSELLGHEEALGRLFPGSLGGRGTHSTQRKARAFLFCRCRESATYSFWGPRGIVYEVGFGNPDPILINLWFPTKIYLLKTSHICLTVWNIVTRNNNKNKSKVDFANKKGFYHKRSLWE